MHTRSSHIRRSLNSCLAVLELLNEKMMIENSIRGVISLLDMNKNATSRRRHIYIYTSSCGAQASHIVCQHDVIFASARNTKVGFLSIVHGGSFG